MRLTQKKVAKLVRAGKPGNHYVGGLGDAKGLRLEIRGKHSASWSTRYQLAGKERWMGLGSAFDFTLSEARERNRVLVRQKIADRLDPMALRRAERAAQAATAAKTVTFSEAVKRFLDEREKGQAWRNDKHAQQWRRTLADYAEPIIGALSVSAIDQSHVFAVLEQKVPARRNHVEGSLWITRTETASRLRARVETILDWAKARAFRSGDNPASWQIIGEVLKRPKVVGDKHHSAMPYDQVAAFVSKLGKRQDVAAKALAFSIMTAARSGETLGARWSEINFKDKTWTVPPARVKSGVEHNVPLAPEAIALLHSLHREGDGEGGFVFVGRSLGAGLSPNALREALRRDGGAGFTVHGFRSSFRDWAAEQNYPAEIAEHALAHAVGSATERAYKHSTLVARRRKLMDAWARYVHTPRPQKGKGKSDNVVALKR